LSLLNALEKLNAANIWPDGAIVHRYFKPNKKVSKAGILVLLDPLLVFVRNEFYHV